jgi:sortase A
MNIIKTIFKSRMRVLMLVLVLLPCSILTLNLITKNIINNELKPAKLEASSISKELPLRIKIPSIKVDALVEKVGITKDGAMGSPVGPDNAGWFDKGPIPGEKGSAVVDGHSGWKNNIPAVFDNLYKLKKGDKIYIESNTSLTTTFIVREIRRYNFTDNTKDVFVSNDSNSHLNLITCIGEWSEKEKGRLERLVVFADIEI